MRILIAGQKRFGRAVLELAIKLGHEVAAVSCPGLETDALRIGALNHQITILPGRLTSDMAPAGLDLIVAAHCHSFLSEKTRRRAELGALGYHPSLLPRHRGRSAIEWAIRMGEKVTGGSVYWLNDVVDGGPIAAQDWCFIRPDDTAGVLWSRELFPMGLRLFARAFAHLEAGVIVAEPQDRSLATWEPAVVNVPPLWRPDVPMLGASRFQIIPDRRATTLPEVPPA